MSPLPLDLYAEVEAADGTRYNWNANASDPGSRLRNLSFSTKIGEGFSNASGQLARRIDADYPDLNLVQMVRVAGADGDVAYEGRLAAMPRELGDSHQIGVTLVGLMAHAKDRRFSEIYVDRDMSAWGNMTARRRSAWLTANWMPQDPQASTDSTDTSVANLSTAISGAWVSPYRPLSEAWYDAGPGNLLGKVGYSWKIDGPLSSADANWNWHVDLSSDDITTSFATSGNLRAAGPSTLQTLTDTTGWRYATIQMFYNATPGGADATIYAIAWSKLAAYGNHGLTLHTGEPGEPQGVYASDVLRDIAVRFCPLLDTIDVEDTDYVIQHLTFKDRTFPYDAFLELNKYHLWDLGVWDHGRLAFRPLDLSEYDWEIRTDDPGTTFAPVGPTTEDLFNGIEVTYTDILTGKQETVTPDDDATLLETSDGNPWNQFGVPHWHPIQLSTPTTRAQAIQIGVAALAEKNRPKTAGSLSVRGYIRDRAGNLQPAWKVRAGDVIRVTNFNEVNRLIVETTYDDESKTLTAAIDFPFQTLDALFDRQQNALTARGLG
jgi:hypothetical protein